MLGKVAIGATPLAEVEFMVKSVFGEREDEELLTFVATLEEMAGSDESRLDLGASSPQEASNKDEAKARAILWEIFITTSLD